MTNKEKKLAKIEKKNRLTLKEMREGSFIGISSESPVYYIYKQKDGKKFLVLREGQCNYKKCKNVCCKFIHSDTDFFKNFGEKAKYQGVIIKKDCKHLCFQTGKCGVWDKKLPEACKQFPHPHDPHYWQIYKKCSFYFVKKYKLTKIKKDKELLKQFKKGLKDLKKGKVIEC